MIGVDWIALNIERALHLRPVSDHESALGASIVPGLLAKDRRSLDITLRIEALLEL